MKKFIEWSTYYLILFAVSAMLLMSCDNDKSEDPGPGPTETELTISSIAPLTAREGDTIKIVGTGFDTEIINNEVLFNENVAGAVISATSTELKVKVPQRDGLDGKIQITVGGASVVSTQSFTLDQSLGTPEIQIIEPTHGLAGSQIFITGKNLVEEGVVTKVFFGTTEGEITGSVDATPPTKRLTITVPQSLAEGEVEVRIERDGKKSNIVKFTVDALPKTIKATYWTDGGAIYRGNVTATGVDVDVIYDADKGGLQSATGIAFNPVDSKVYFVGTCNSCGEGLILRAPADGSGPIETLYSYTEDLNGGLPSYDIALDIPNETLYVTVIADGKDQIVKGHYGDLDDDVDVLYETTGGSSGDALGVKLDIPNGKIYWNEAISKRVVEGSMDGTQEAKPLFDTSDGLDRPYNLAIDSENGKIFIIDNPRSSSEKKDAIYVGSLDGSGSLTAIVNQGDDLSGGFDVEVDLENQFVLWLSPAPDGNGQQLKRSKYDGSSIESLFSSDKVQGAGFFDLDIR